ncbi:tetratricopeptide repeat protein [Mangrovimicrobium sediminis]|uniref:non-specific serine/threonine protein kinase n=1 Tax=Mangrovimicrobium sediminis TaxID=2562682 RepID=A0A4Z0M622_9GAMM|nr:protein kinase [Haliea sp. SAOS-164]TGD74755.1 tetratricopeptide repeat protein [Haliea sp. SAOS-164]
MADFELPGYELYERLGRGGMATVYRALHLNLDREVAIKVMDPAMNADETFSERFIREARISARLIHPHILQIYDVNTHNGLNYIAMELLPGGELADFIHGEMPQRQIYTLLRQMTEALDYAAGRGYVHRDIKPSNIMLRSAEEFVLADFGIARAANSGTQMTQTGLMVGTPSYMSPEQAKGEEVDGRSDLYALGVLTYEMLTKELPYESDSAVTTAVKHLTEAIPTLPESLSAYQPFIDKALAKAAEERFQTGAEFYRAFMEASADFDDDQVLTPAAPPKPQRNSRASESVAERTSLAGADSTRLSQSSSPALSGSSRPYRLENSQQGEGPGSSQQRERLVSGTFERGGRKARKSSSAWVAIVIILVAAGGGGLFWWQTQRDSASSAVENQRAITSELAQAYSAMNRDELVAAANAFQLVLSMDAQNSAAQQGMAEIERLFPGVIEAALASGDTAAAGRLVDEFSDYFAGSAELERLRSEFGLATEENKLAAAREERLRQQLAAADQHLEAGDLDQADDLLQQAAALDPQAPGLAERQQALADARARSSAYEERWAGYSDEQRIAFVAAIERADSALDAGELDAASRALADAAAIAPDMPEAAPRQERLDAALAAHDAALAEQRSQLDTQLDQAEAAVASNPGRAAELFREIAAEHPDEPRVARGFAAIAGQSLEQARSAAAQGDFDAARSALARGEELVPGNADLAAYAQKLPGLESAWQQREAALAAEREALKAALQEVEDAVSSAQRAVSDGDLVQAQSAFDELKNSNPDLPSLQSLGEDLRAAYASSARAQAAENEFEDAVKLVDLGAEHFPDDPRWSALRSEIEDARASARRRLGVY